VRALVRSRNRPIAILTLIALLIGQSVAGLHVLKHFGLRGESAKLPGQHMQLCLECASFAPLAGAQGGTVTSLTVAFIAADRLLPPAGVAPAGHGLRVLYLSRAPPRRSLPCC
jgi:hypothetical protein